MKLKMTYTSRQPQVLIRKREIEWTEVQLQLQLDQLTKYENDLNVTARDLMDYLDGRGQLATYIGVAGREDDIRELLNRLAHAARYSENQSTLIEHGVGEEGDEDDFRCSRASTVLD